MKKLTFILLFLMISSKIITNCETIKFDNYLLNLKVEKKDKKEEIIQKIAMIESSGNPDAFNEKENAAGLLQIRPVMVKEINRLIGEHRYTLEDRWCPETSKEMFITYQNHVNPEWDEEIAAKRWNGGIRGERNPNTEKYYQKYLEL